MNTDKGNTDETDKVENRGGSAVASWTSQTQLMHEAEH
jgi:hypothetical protein